MAEIFGVIAGVVGVAETGMKLSTKLRYLAHTWANAADEILALSNEVSDLTTVLNFTKSICEEAKHDVNIDETFSIALKQHISTPQAVLEEINGAIVSLEAHNTEISEGTRRRKWKWLHLKKSVIARKEDVNASRQKIWELLQVYQLSTGSRIQLELSSMQLELRKNTATTLGGLDSLNQKLASFDTQLDYLLKSAAHDDSSSSRFREALSEIAVESKHHDAQFHSDPTQGHSHNTAIQSQGHHNTFSVWAVYRHRTCSTGCICSCHNTTSSRPRAGRTSGAAFLRHLLGSFFASYTAFPGWIKAETCDTIMCHRQTSRTWEAGYEFPLWLANWNMHAILHRASTSAPSVSLVFRHRVAYRYDGIFQSVDSNNLDAVRAILQRNPDSVNYRLYRNGSTPLHMACLRPTKISFEIFQLLLRAGADLNAETDSGRSVASYVAGQMVLGGFPAEHKRELSRWVSLSHILDELELSPITKVAVDYTTRTDVRRMVRMMPPSRSRLTEFDNTGSLPLCWASKAGNLEAVQAIVEACGVNATNTHRTSTGNTPLMCAFAPSSTSATRPKGLEVLDWLIDHGADPLLRNKDGYNALTLACYLGRSDVVEHLLSRCALDPNTPDGSGRTGLWCAIAYDHDHIARYLCKTGARTDAVPNTKRLPPAMVAVGVNAHRCLRLLLFEMRTTPQQLTTPWGWSILHHAGLCANLETMAILAEHGLSGMDVHAREPESGWTPEDALLNRTSGPSGPVMAAFRNLLAVVKRNTASEIKEK